MNALDEYLSGTYDHDKRQIRLIQKLVNMALPVFTHRDVFDEKNNTWPYKLPQTRSSGPAGNFSYSTHSMILFALEVINEPLSNSVLMPTASHSLEFERPRNFDYVLRQSKQGLTTALSPSLEEPLTRSETWGDEDPLTLTWLCELANAWRGREGESLSGPIEQALSDAARRTCGRAKKGEPLLRWTEKKRAVRHVADHAFLKLRGNHLARAAKNLKPDLKPETIPKLVPPAWFEQAIKEQLAYASVPDSRFAPGQLAFALEGILQQERHALSSSTIKHIFETLERSQVGAAHWRPVMPLFSTAQGMVLYPVSVEIAASLLRTCEILDDDPQSRAYPANFSRLEPQLRHYCDWLGARVERVGEHVGWHSEHVNEPGTIHLWETSLVLIFLVHYAAMLQRKIAADGLRAANLIPKFDIAKFESYWSEEPLQSVPKDSRYRVLKTIKEKYVDKKRAHGSILLYGPPGTGKTTLAEQMAAWTDRAFVGVTVSDFLAGGAAEVEARAKGIFRVLCEQSEVIILLDEIDQFLLDRDSEAYKKQTGIFQFMTPGMLTKLEELKDQKQSIFIVATNYADRIDSAIKRQGRIERRLLLSIAGESQRLDFILKFLKEEHDIELEAEMFQAESKRSHLNTESRLFGYGDLKILVKDCQLTSKTDPAMIAKDLTSACSGIVPSVKLEFYSNRFQGGDVGNELVEEFFLLVYLLAEMEAAPKDAEWAVIDTALANIKNKEEKSSDWISIEDRLKKALPDEQEVTSTLVKWLKNYFDEKAPARLLS